MTYLNRYENFTILLSTENASFIANNSWDVGKASAREHYLMGARSVQFIIFILFAGIVIHFGSKRYHYPETVGCFLFGVAIGFLDVYSQFIRNFSILSRMDPSDMMLTFLPILIFESSFGMDAHMFYRALFQCLILALPGILFCTALTAVFAKYVLVYYEWSWIVALLFGSIVSATDPVAVVALLKEMRMPHSFTILIEGESLLNDGVAIVLFETLSHIVYSRSQLSFLNSAINLLKTCFGAPTFGYLMAKITEFILNEIYISPVSEMTLTLIQAYTTYFIAERFLGVSAVLAVVLYGVTLNSNKMCISPESESLIHTDWKLLSIYTNTIIFTFVGILISVNLSESFDFMDVGLIFATYIALNIIRGMMIAISYPILTCTGYGLTWKESVILAWGGLRGAIGLALALMFATNPKIDATVKADKVLVQVSGIIILTLLINATTIKFIMKLIKFKDVTLVHRLSMGNAIACVNEMREKSVRICKNDWKYKIADWTWLMKKTKLHDPYKGGLYGNDPAMHSLFIPYGTCDECLMSLLPYMPNDFEKVELNEAARKKVLRAFKGNLWKQFRNGLIQRRALKFLSMAVDNASDSPNVYLKAEDISSKLAKVNAANQWMERKISHFFSKMIYLETPYEKEIHSLKTEHCKGYRKFCLRIYLSWWFEPFMMLVIVLNVVQISMDIMYIVNSSGTSVSAKVMCFLCALFTLIYALETVIRIVSLRWHRFIKGLWNKLCFVLTLLAIIEGTVDFVLMTYFVSKHNAAAHIRILIAVRLLTGARTLKLLLFQILSVLRNIASRELYYAYDIYRGFLFANEAVLKKIDAIVDFGPCAKYPVSVCEDNIQKMLFTLLQFEEEHPDVTFALKSNRAARRILNRAKEVLERFKEKSFILRDDLKELKHLLFEMTKKVVYAPKTRKIIEDIPEILEESDWIRNADMKEDIFENHVISSFKTGEIIQQAGVAHQFVYIIATGIVKIIGQRSEPGSSSSHLYNTLPNTDAFSLFEGEDIEVKDYLMISQTIGLLGYLQKTDSVTTAVCERDCQLIQINYAFLNGSEKKDDIIYSMWRHAAIHVADAVLKQQSRYLDFSDEDIMSRLQRGILPDLTYISILDVPSVVDDMIIIQGRAKDIVTSARFIGPAYIPGTYRSLVLYDDIRKRPPTIIILLLNEMCNFKTCQHWITLQDIKASGACEKHN